MADIFLSYSRKDSDIADELVSLLQEEGWSVWYDTNIEAGRRFRTDIENELDKAKVVLTLWSVDSVQSMWVNAEAEDAAKNAKLVPIRLDQCSIPLTLRAYQAIDFSDWRGNPNELQWQSLREYISRLAGRPGIPEIPFSHDCLVGTGDDATHKTISEALSVAAEGAIIGVQAGTYSESLAVSKEVLLIGYGKDECEVIIDGGDFPAITIKNTTVRLQSLSLTSSQKARTGVVEADASNVFLDHVEIHTNENASCIRSGSRGKLELRDCKLLGGKLACHAAFQSEVHVMRCVSKNQTGNGFFISQGSKLIMHNSTVDHSGGCGILADQLADVKVRSSEFNNHKVAGIEVTGGSEGDICFCKFSDNGQGIRASRKRTSVVIVSNEIQRSEYSCIHVLNFAKARIVYNKLTTSNGGVIVFENAEIEASRNEITGHEGHGIEVRDGSKARLDHNLISRISQQGLRCGKDTKTDSFSDHIAMTKLQGVACINAQLRIEDMIVAETSEAGIGLFENAEVVLHRVLVDSSRVTGVEVQQSNLEATDLTIEAPNEHGIWLDGNSIAQLTECEIIGSGYSGMRVESQKSVTIEKCKISDGNDYGIHLMKGSQAKILSSIISKNRLAGICLEEGAEPLILSNLVEENLAEGLQILGVGGGSVELTVFRNNSTGISSTVPQNESKTRVKGVTDDPLNYEAN